MSWWRISMEFSCQMSTFACCPRVTMLCLVFMMLWFMHCNALCRFSPSSHVQLLTSSTRLFASKIGVRPSLDDVERISRGDAAKRRGTGSRMVPHRLNQLERKEWVLAKKRRFLLLRGSGYRKERGASPLANIYRQFCDAQDILCITVARGVGQSDPVDEVCIDFSPLRTIEVAQIAQDCLSEAQKYGSFQGSIDNSDVNGLGWNVSDIQTMLEEDVIWRIPVYSIVATFSQRADSRRFAESLAQTYANGRIVSDDADQDVDDESNTDENDEEDAAKVPIV